MEFKSVPLRLMFERAYFQRDHNVLAIYNIHRMARDEFRLAFEDVKTFELPLKLNITDMYVEFPAGNQLKFMVIDHFNTERVMGWQLVDFFVHDSLRDKWWYDRLMQMLACRVRSK